MFYICYTHVIDTYTFIILKMTTIITSNEKDIDNISEKMLNTGELEHLKLFGIDSDKHKKSVFIQYDADELGKLNKNYDDFLNRKSLNKMRKIPPKKSDSIKITKRKYQKSKKFQKSIQNKILLPYEKKNCIYTINIIENTKDDLKNVDIDCVLSNNIDFLNIFEKN